MTDINDVLKQLPKDWFARPPMSGSVSTILSKNLMQAFQDDFIAYHMQSDGGEGRLGKIYVTLWPLSDSERLTKEYRFHEYMHPDLLAIGTADDAFIALDFSGGDIQWVVFPFGDFDLDEICTINDTFTGLLVSFIDNQFPEKARRLLLPK